MKLDKRTMRLIAVGASITANCQPCLQTNVAAALECGIGEEEIAEAVEVGRKVRQGAASKMDRFALDMSREAPSPANVVDGGCGCSL